MHNLEKFGIFGQSLPVLGLGISLAACGGSGSSGMAAAAAPAATGTAATTQQAPGSNNAVPAASGTSATVSRTSPPAAPGGSGSAVESGSSSTIKSTGGNGSTSATATGSGSNSSGSIGGSLTAGTKLWSTLGVIADGATDNTAALNALPANVNITGDCPAGRPIVVKDRWLWHSNLTIAIQPGCRMISYVTGGGSATYAITQADLNQPLVNVSVDGLNISSEVATSEDIIMKLWINNFSLLHWTVAKSGGVMVIRGSNQEIAYGTATNTYPLIGNPGIRHVGNMPKVPTSVGRPANVYIHDNSIQSGDATYQACQPLSSLVWTDVSSDDILFQNNVGYSSDAAFILIGETPKSVASYTNWTCSNIVFDNDNGSGKNKSVYISSVGLSNPLSNIKVANSVIDGSGGSRVFGTVEVTAVGGSITALSFDNVAIKNAPYMALSTVGGVTGFSFDHGEIDAPTMGGDPTVKILDAHQVSITNSTIGANRGDALQLGPNDTAGVRHPVTQMTLSGNVFNRIANDFAAVRMFNVNHGYVGANTMNSVAGANLSMGIFFSVSSTSGPGTANTAATKNILSGIDGADKIVFAPNAGNSISNNTY